MLALILKFQRNEKKILDDDFFHTKLGYKNIHEMVGKRITENPENNIFYIVEEYKFIILNQKGSKINYIFVSNK